MSNLYEGNTWHFVRCCDLETRRLRWTNTSSTYTGDAVSISAHGIAAHGRRISNHY